MNKFDSKILLKDVSGLEPYEDWWNYEVQIKEITYKGELINLHTHPIYNYKNLEHQMNSPYYVLISILDLFSIEYREYDYSPDNYDKYLIDILNKNGFEVLFEAHDDLIKYETKGIVSAINPKYKKLSKIDDFIFAEDISYNFLYDVFKGIKVDSILSYIKISSVKNHNCSVLSDKILQNILNTYGTTLSFYKLLYDAINTNIIGENNDRTN